MTFSLTLKIGWYYANNSTLISFPFAFNCPNEPLEWSEAAGILAGQVAPAPRHSSLSPLPVLLPLSACRPQDISD
jgi:hypothetical protein